MRNIIFPSTFSIYAKTTAMEPILFIGISARAQKFQAGLIKNKKCYSGTVTRPNNYEDPIFVNQISYWILTS